MTLPQWDKTRIFGQLFICLNLDADIYNLTLLNIKLAIKLESNREILNVKSMIECPSS